MGGKRIKRRLIHIPANFLQEFDQEIKDMYTSRNEAIRAGMALIMENEKRRTTEKTKNKKQTSTLNKTQKKKQASTTP